MSSKINLQTCEYARKSSIFQDNQLIYFIKLESYLKIKDIGLQKYIYYARYMCLFCMLQIIYLVIFYVMFVIV